MKELIKQIKLKVDRLDDKTKESRARKGAYVDCLIMAKQESKNLKGQHHKLLCSFFLWFRENGEKYIDESIEQMIDIYQKQSNI